IRLGSRDRDELHMHAKKPGAELIPVPTDLEVSYAEALSDREKPYRRLLEDALDGDDRRVVREDSLDLQRRILPAELGQDDEVEIYERRSMGRPMSLKMADDVGGWTALRGGA